MEETKYVINELLMYVFCKLDSDNLVDLRNTLDHFYCEDAVDAAKTALWEAYSDKIGRNIQHRSKVKHLDAILEAAQTVCASFPDKATFPIVFVAVNCSNLPTCTQSANSTTADSMETRMTAVELQLKEVLANQKKNVQQPVPYNPPQQQQLYSKRLEYGMQQHPLYQNPVGGTLNARSVGPTPTPTSTRTVPPPAPTPAALSTVPPAVPPAQVPHDPSTAEPNRWQHVTHRRPQSRRAPAVYGNKESNVLKAPERTYECVVFNVTTSNKEDIKTWVSDNGVNVLDVSRLSGDTTTRHLFHVKVPHSDKDKVASADFWPTSVGCRPYFKRKNWHTNRINTVHNNNNGS